MDELLRQRNAQMETELEKKCAALLQCEKTLKAKEMSHSQRVKTLEEQVSLLFANMNCQNSEFNWESSE